MVLLYLFICAYLLAKNVIKKEKNKFISHISSIHNYTKRAMYAIRVKCNFLVLYVNYFANSIIYKQKKESTIIMLNDFTNYASCYVKGSNIHLLLYD